MSGGWSDAELAAQLAVAAGHQLLALQQQAGMTRQALGQAGDQRANAYLMDMLRQHRPEDAVLCEEERDGAARLNASRVWIVDPLDGTREFGEGRSDWAVHVALAVDGKPMIGAVALPAVGLVLRTDQPPPVPPAAVRPRMVVSRSRPAAEALAVAASLGAELIAMGSAGAKAMAVVRGEADIYLHTGGQYEWDSCAPVAVALACGLHASRIDGSPLIYNQANVYMPDLLICRPEWAAKILDLVSGC
jgi:3'(2'), 5'-bisphosphate nucleotidase